ncbi:50S ribosomal protein L4, partial [Dehalococcoidia bacterium]|nr:50S ribosomal protein L4 [Dehalococcoidia bacterium]
GEVAGGGKKPWAQKHTGRARTGSRRSPIFRHGGITFGPRPRDYSQDMPKKMRRLAIKCMLSDKHGSGTLTVIQALDLTDGKTQEVVKLLGALSIQGSTLVVTRNPDEKVKRSAKNLSKVKTLPAALLNVGDLLQYESLVMTVDAVRQAEELWAKPGNRQQLPEEAEPKRKRRSPRKPAS